MTPVQGVGLTPVQGTPPCNFGFSTKYRDPETGDVNYGLRILRPPLGRWINRDPAEERAGLNLFCFVANNGGEQCGFIRINDCSTTGRWNRY